MINDRKLVKRVKQTRDMVAFQSLVIAHQKRIYGLIRKTVRVHEDCEDILQETFMKVLRNIDQLRDPGKFSTWLSIIAINLSLNFVQQRCGKKAMSIDGDLPPDIKELTDEKAQERPMNVLQADEIITHLNSALVKLPSKHRTAFVLFHQHEMRMKEIAEIMDCPETTGRTYVFRAVKNLRKQLKDYYDLIKE